MSDEIKNPEIQPNLILDDEKAMLLNHNYDGIQELDNPLPKWWQIIFYGTIVFTVLYIGYYEFGGGPSLRQEMESDLARIEAMRPKNAGGDLLAAVQSALGDAAVIAEGQASYAGKCASCHADQGQGLIGPNLTDYHWIHGDGSAGEIYKVVADGVADKGMPPWGAVIPADEMKSLLVYLLSLRGQMRAGKPPEGVEHKPN
ncbi:MAG TPA: cbb3-type cytochrome c oxidase N-terminal domain-containing protein [Pseudobdellovibrionaceae bacterium]|nr:cbb3-type cytochrome c oxidase N-terminal domain-containing protein [Pseudobdellovibrionaceae bacterium]